MSSKNIAELTGAQYPEKIANSKGLSMIDFGAPWCPPCRALLPTLEELAETFKDTVPIYSVNTDNDPELAMRFGVKSLPTVILFKDGEPVEEILGRHSAQRYIDAIQRAL